MAKSPSSVTGYQICSFEPLDWQKAPEFYRLEIVVSMETYHLIARDLNNQLKDAEVHPTFGLAMMAACVAICRAELTSKVKYTAVDSGKWVRT